MFILDDETFEESIKLLNINIELSQSVPKDPVVQVPLCCQLPHSSVISSTAKDDHLFKIYQSDLTKNWSILSLDKDKSTSVLEASVLEIVIFSHGAKTVLLEARLDTSTNQVIR
jgi:hypothetical protein